MEERDKHQLRCFLEMPHFDTIKTDVENIVRKREMACNKLFPIYLQCFPPYMALVFHF